MIGVEMIEVLDRNDESEQYRLEDARFRERIYAKNMNNKGFCMNSRDSEESFWRNVKKSEGCWGWRGRKCLDGRVGVCWVFVDGRRIYMTAHRYMWILKHGKILDDKVVRQRCGNGLCVNPAHLEIEKDQRICQQS